MIVWSGFGILVPVIAFIGVALGSIAGERFGEPAGLLLAGVAIWFLGRRLNDPSKGRVLLDPVTGQSVTVRRRNSLFFINMEYWAFAAAIMAQVLLFNPSPK